MNKSEFNRKAAEYMGFKYKFFKKNHYVGLWNEKSGNWLIPFNPYDDANDRNKVISEMRINTTPDGFHKNDGWVCKTVYFDKDFPDHLTKNKSMEQAQRLCIEAVLKVNEDE